MFIVGCCTLKVNPESVPCSKTPVASLCKKANKMFRKYAEDRGFIILHDTETYVIHRWQAVGINDTTVGYCEYYPWDGDRYTYLLSDYAYGNMTDSRNWKILWTILHEKGHQIGLEHVEDVTDLMYPYVPTIQPYWFHKLLQEFE